MNEIIIFVVVFTTTFPLAVLRQRLRPKPYQRTRHTRTATRPRTPQPRPGDPW